MPLNEGTEGQGLAVVQTSELTKAFGDLKAVDRLSFEIPKGTIFGLIGPSGCGKTTTVRLLTGIYRPSGGKASVLGENPARFSRETRTKIGYMLQQSVLYPDLTVWENLNFASAIYGVGPLRGKQLREVLEFVELSEHRRKPVSKISGGMRRRLGLAATLAHNPELLFLDEPTTGVDPVLRRKFWDHFEALRDEGRTLLVTTQYVGEAAYCDLVAVMQQGRLLRVDTPEGLRCHAFGGEIVELQTANHLDLGKARRLDALPAVRQVHLLENGRARLVVDEASTAIPRLVEWSQEEELALKSIGEYLPPFDDVFVKLIQGPEGVSLG
ncbi:MAG: ABC transporter ATP-binding protein [Anaerolineae bacterium]|nr:ABC transporter ATP-binding protein [Anaerolineae bacterium]